jgi:hypothetical protein
MSRLAMQLRSRHRAMWSQLRVLLCCILLISASAQGQVQGDAPEETTNVRVVTSAEYRGHLGNLKMLVEACQKNPAECDSKKVGDDERVEGAGFQTRWSWLREVLSSAHNARQSDREKQLQEAAARLDEDAVLAADAAPQTADTFPRARKQADDVLSRPEFRTVTEASYWQREIAKLWQWVAEMFGGVSRFGKRSPWLGSADGVVLDHGGGRRCADVGVSNDAATAAGCPN